MIEHPAPNWLDWAQRLNAIAQTGLFYASDPHDTARYTELRQIAAEMIAAHTTLDVAQLTQLLGHDQGYATPKVGVRAVVPQGKKLLMVYQHDDGGWSLPGGWCDVRESPAEAVVREVYEETRCRVRPVKLLAVHDPNKHGQTTLLFHRYRLVFQCELLDAGGATVDSAAQPYDSGEVGAMAFFTPDALPPLSTGRVTPVQIARYVEHLQDPYLATDFD